MDSRAPGGHGPLRARAGAPTPRCAERAQHRGDPLAGSASPVQRWLLVEQPGPWGRDALTGSRIDPAVARALAGRSRDGGFRVLLVRRPGRHPPPRVRQWAVVRSTPGAERAWWGTFGDDRELLTVPVDGSAGTPSTEPAYLVCAHGRHDPCCALRGRPVAAALAARRAEAVWECSHLGGDRFAANLLVLPHGFYYGQLTPARAVQAAMAYEAGTVVPAQLRGRCTFAPPVQAAQHYARAVLDIRSVDALAPREAVLVSRHTWQVTLSTADGHVTVTVREQPWSAPALLTCGAEVAAAPRGFALEGITLPGLGDQPTAQGE